MNLACLRQGHLLWRSSVVLITSLGAAAIVTSGAVSAVAASAPGPSGGGSALAPELPAGVVSASAAPRSTWKPEPAGYGTASLNDVPVTMADGTVLRVNVIYPTNGTGKEAAGPFPVPLTHAT